MRNWKTTIAAAAAALLALPAALSAEVFAWRTEDGVYAYTDDPKRVPERYADQVVAVSDTGLEGYPRLTRENSERSRAVAERLARRLEHLRRVNAAPAVGAHAAAPEARTMSVSTGGENAPKLDLPVRAGEGPIVVEPVLSRRPGDVVTRRTTVVKQGDRTIAVLKGRSRHTDVNAFVDEEALVGD